MREVVLDTETTGLSPDDGHRIIEIGCIELLNHLPTGEQFHSLFNPGREVPLAATEIHGLKTEDLSDMPSFQERAEDFIAFIRDAPLVIHNAQFDITFLNTELSMINLPLLDMDQTVDTLILARRKFPGSPASLDALCKRFSIDNSARGKHSALLDADLLAQVYIELIGGRQANLSLTSAAEEEMVNTPAKVATRRWSPHSPTAAEREQHTVLLRKLTDPVWMA